MSEWASELGPSWMAVKYPSKRATKEKECLKEGWKEGRKEGRKANAARTKIAPMILSSIANLCLPAHFGTRIRELGVGTLEEWDDRRDGTVGIS